jgi:hypothetical protein
LFDELFLFAFDRDQPDHLGTPASFEAAIELLSHTIERLVEILLAHLLVEHVVFGALETDTRETVGAVLAIHAKCEIARSFTTPAVLEVATLLTRNASLALGTAHAIDTVLAVGAVLAAVAALTKTAVVAGVAALTTEVPLSGVVLALLLMSLEKLIDAREELIEVEWRSAHAPPP